MALINGDPTGGRFGELTKKLPEMGISEYVLPLLTGGKIAGSTGSTGGQTAKQFYTNPATYVQGATKALTGAQPQVMGVNDSQAYLNTPNTLSGGGTPTSGGGGKTGDKTTGDKQDTYSKSDAAAKLGLTSAQLTAQAKAAGFDSTEEYLNSGILQETENAYEEALKYLNKAKSGLQDQYGGVVNDIGSLIGESKATAKQQYESGDTLLNQQLMAGDARRRDALTDAVRTFQELAMGGAQRFGGASSAGEAFQAIAGQQLQRGRQQAASEFNQFAQQIATAKQNLQAQYTTVLQNLDSEKTRLVNEATRDFQNKLLEIDRLKSEAGQNKAAARLNALQDLRNQQFQIQLATQQAQLQAQNDLAAQVAQLDQALSQAGQVDPTQIQNTYSDNLGGSDLTGAGAMAMTPTGAISTRRPEDFYGTLG